jgi:uncharacterized protein YjbI with pentapeptide repeats
MPKWLPSLHDPDPPRLWRIQYALAACFAVALAGLAALWAIALVLLHHPALPRSHVISVRNTVGVAQLVFASVAGAGALVALVVAYRRQRVSEASSAHDRTRVFNERFTTIAAQLGHEQSAVRLAGVHAMAGLADDWKENRQTCVDVLCAYLRLPYDPDPGDDAAPEKLAAYRANREVRHTIIRLIGNHLRPTAAVPWHGLSLDFTGVVFDGGDFVGVRFSGGVVRFESAEFSGGTVSFALAEFSSGTVNFADAKFSGGEVSFAHANFSGGTVFFGNTEFSGGEVNFTFAMFSGSTVIFRNTDFSGGTVSFGNTEFSGGGVTFTYAKFSGSTVSFANAEVSGGTVFFGKTEFPGGTVSFANAEFSGGMVFFGKTEFSGGTVAFNGAEFSGGSVDFSDASEWSRPPLFDWDGTPPAGVMLPTGADARRPDFLGTETAE